MGHHSERAFATLACLIFLIIIKDGLYQRNNKSWKKRTSAFVHHFHTPHSTTTWYRLHGRYLLLEPQGATPPPVSEGNLIFFLESLTPAAFALGCSLNWPYRTPRMLHQKAPVSRSPSQCTVLTPSPRASRGIHNEGNLVRWRRLDDTLSRGAAAALFIGSFFCPLLVRFGVSLAIAVIIDANAVVTPHHPAFMPIKSGALVGATYPSATTDNAASLAWS